MIIIELRCSKCNKMLGIFSKVDGTEVVEEFKHIPETNTDFSYQLEMKCPRCKTTTKLGLTEALLR